MIPLLLFTLVRPTHIPTLSRIFGARVGFDGRRKLEREFGLGTYSVGGHPHGTETWLIRSPSSTIQVDGFSYVRDGELIETLVWQATRGASGKQKIARSKGWLGCILLGDSKASVLRRSSKFLPKPAIENRTLLWRAHGYKRAYENPNTFTRWSGNLSFDEDNRLASIEISAR